ncbi:MAG TPA: DivIVA domain-containing protein [Solirubrobacteraceae bacterium]|nr:DivIVA domain-containing protein [Solirubrobacteraceae bacterium]
MPDQSSAATEHAILAEITRPLEALPSDPLSIVDANFPSALRGYDRVAVDDYVRQTRQLVAELQATRSPEAAVRRALERVGEQISGILQRAHETAEQITAQSRGEAEDRLEEARGEALQIVEAAEQRVKDLDADTDRIWLERQRIVADAEDLAAQLLALAKTAADRFPADAGAEAEAQAVKSANASYDAPEPEVAAYDEGDEVEDPYEVEETGAEDPDEVEETVAEDPSEIERTVAFQPLKPEEDRDEEADQDAPPTRDEPPAPERSGSEDDTAVIPPASQAANRRQNQ